MKVKKWGAIVAAGALVAALGLFGCSSSTGTQASSEDSATDYTLLNEGKLTMLSSPDYPPFENLVDGEVVGFEVDLLQAVSQELGLELVIEPLQFDGIIPALVAGGQGDIGVSGFSITPERLEQVDFTDSFYTDDQAVAVLPSSGITADNAATALNAEGVVIAVQSGTTGELYCQENYPNATLMALGSSTDCFAAMQAGQATAVCTNYAVVGSMLKEAYAEAQIVVTVATGEEYGIAVPKDNPGLTAAINEALAKLEADGTLKEITERWF